MRPAQHRLVELVNYRGKGQKLPHASMSTTPVKAMFFDRAGEREHWGIIFEAAANLSIYLPEHVDIRGLEDREIRQLCTKRFPDILNKITIGSTAALLKSKHRQAVLLLLGGAGVHASTDASRVVTASAEACAYINY